MRDLIENDLALLLTERFAATLPVGVAAPPLADRPRHNLPNLLTSFIGREKEIADIKARLNTARLVTLTGSGGAGKTRLSLQLAEDQLAEFEDGVWLGRTGAAC